LFFDDVPAAKVKTVIALILERFSPINCPNTAGFPTKLQESSREFVLSIPRSAGFLEKFSGECYARSAMNFAWASEFASFQGFNADTAGIFFFVRLWVPALFPTRAF